MDQQRFLLNTGLLLLALACYTSQAKAADPVANTAQGKKLYETHCFSCHDSKIHTRPETIIHSFSALKKRVQFCQNNNQLNWSATQIDNVVAHLNDTFYKFKTK